MYSLSNEQFHIKVKEEGLELSSFFSKNTQTEYMWQGDPTVWPGQAPVLFPIIGGLRDGVYRFREKEYKLPKHGFIRHSTKLVCKERTETKLVFELKADEETLAMYPFEFLFRLTYELIGSKLEVKHEVCNWEEDSMYFSLGGHPAFACPRRENESYDDFYLEFETQETDHTYRVLENGLIGDETEPILKNTKTLGLSPELFVKDALVFKNLKSRICSLKCTKSNAVVRVEYPGFPYLGIWAKPVGKFVCIEPWMGISDVWNSKQDFTTKEGIIELDAGKNFEVSYFILVEE